MSRFTQYIIEYDDVEGVVCLLGLEAKGNGFKSPNAWLELMNEDDIACPESYAWGMYDVMTKRFDALSVEVVNVNH